MNGREDWKIFPGKNSGIYFFDGSTDHVNHCALDLFTFYALGIDYHLLLSSRAGSSKPLSKFQI